MTDRAESDVALLAAWRDGDEKAGRALFGRYYDRVYRFFATKTSSGIEDLVQETFLACVEGRDRMRDDASLRTFVFAVARRRLYRRWRDENRGAGAIDFGLTSVVDLGPSPSGFAAEHEEQRVLVAAMRRLPVDLQVALELFYWEEMPAPALARVLEIPEGTVRSRLRRARSLLEEELDRVPEDPALVEGTKRDLESWVRSIRGRVPAHSPPVE